MEIEREVEVTIECECPQCGHKFEQTSTEEVTIEIEPDDWKADMD